MGIFLVTILAMIGLLGPTLKSVSDVEKTDEVVSVVNTVNAFLQSSPDIGDQTATPPVTKFDAIYRAVVSDDHATIFVFRRFEDDTSTEVELEIGFRGDNGVNPAAELAAADFNNLAGPVYRVVLSASSVMPEATLESPTRDSDTGVFSLAESDPADYPEGYLALEVRIFDLETDTTGSAGGSGAVPPESDLETLSELDPLFTYDTAVVR
ncbi:MAG: hypothetical protein ACLFS1_07745 [Opitutales bacterium]